MIPPVSFIRFIFIGVPRVGGGDPVAVLYPPHSERVPRVGGGDPTSLTLKGGILECSPRRRG